MLSSLKPRHYVGRNDGGSGRSRQPDILSVVVPLHDVLSVRLLSVECPAYGAFDTLWFIVMVFAIAVLRQEILHVVASVLLYEASFLDVTGA